MVSNRASGLLLHITSLPSQYGIGDLGPQAYRFADFLAQAGQTYWQILPLNPPTLRENPFSPYNCLSAFAGNLLLLSPEMLYRQGVIAKKDLAENISFSDDSVDYRAVVRYKNRLFKKIGSRLHSVTKKPAYKRFCDENGFWLEDFATFVVLRRLFRNRLWCYWPAELRDRQKNAVRQARKDFCDEIEFEKVLQFLFFDQWFALKTYCHRLGIEIIGDIPIYVAYDSADLWANPELFKLTKTKKPAFVGGVPPDYFSRTGQLWGNPVYNWRMHRQTDYRWWIQRIKYNLGLFDLARFDHFRGLAGFWQVPAGCKTAKKGRWVTAPGRQFLHKVFEVVPSSSIIVEDLGVITPDVGRLIRKFGLTPMRVLQFAFDGDPAKNPHCPHNHIRNCVVYTGTHDTNTARGWFEDEVGPQQKKRLLDYIGGKPKAGQVHWAFTRLAAGSVADLAIIPMQDILGLGSRARMNKPATFKNNWRWRLTSDQMKTSVARKLAALTAAFGRTR